MKIAVAGLGYVGIANSIMLAQKNDVIAFDICESKVNDLNEKRVFVQGDNIDEYVLSSKLSLRATTSIKVAFSDAEYIFIALPTDYNTFSNKLDTSIVENSIMSALKINSSAIIIIKSTVPIGFTEYIKRKYDTDNIIYIPEFLREKTCLNDVLYPSRIIVGDKSLVGRKVADVLMSGVKRDNTPIVFTNSTEAEAIKLFSNAYLAMRISFFNEMDSFASQNGLNIDDMIDGVSLDPRIGDYYNIPSLYYGGYCLPKDTKQLLRDFKSVPQSIISAIVNANETRIDYVVNDIMLKNPKTIGFYKLMKDSLHHKIGYDAGKEMMERFVSKGIECIAYESYMNDKSYIIDNVVITNDFNRFKKECSIILTNVWDDNLLEIKDKVYRPNVV